MKKVHITSLVIIVVAVVVGLVVVSGGNTSQAAFRDFDPAVDHVRGAVDPQVVIIEFSDFQCPFCSRLHPTLTRITQEFPDDVAWVYRHLPLTTIHSEAARAAIASECVADLAGNEAFWTFADSLFLNMHRLGTDLYVEHAALLGIDPDTLGECYQNEKIAQRVEADMNEAVAAGAQGTPFMVIIDKEGNKRSLRGALPYEQIQSLVREALAS